MQLCQVITDGDNIKTTLDLPEEYTLTGDGCKPVRTFGPMTENLFTMEGSFPSYGFPFSTSYDPIHFYALPSGGNVEVTLTEVPASYSSITVSGYLQRHKDQDQAPFFSGPQISFNDVPVVTLDEFYSTKSDEYNVLLFYPHFFWLIKMEGTKSTFLFHKPV